MLIKKFISSETGAVTVDWVVLTAAIALLGIAINATFARGTLDLAGDVTTYMDSQTVAGDQNP